MSVDRMSVDRTDEVSSPDTLDAIIRNGFDRLAASSAPSVNVRQRIMAAARQRAAVQYERSKQPERSIWLPDHYMAERRAAVMLTAIRNMTGPMMFTIR